MQTLYFRTEASPRIGMGHFMRCFAVAEAARGNDQPVVFLLNDAMPAVLARLEAIGATRQVLTTDIGTVEDTEAIRHLMDADKPLIIDSYKVNAPYLKALDTTTQLVVFDDLAAHALHCRIVINAAIAAADMPYAALAPDARRLIGPDYAPVRQEFREVVATPGDSIAIMFGGSDAKGLSLKTSQTILKTLEKIDVRVIVGPGLLNSEALHAMAASEPRLTIIKAPESVAETLKDARIVVTAAGTSVAEIATMGLMALVLVIADNQMAHMQTCPYPVRDARDDLPDDTGEWVRGFYDDRNTLGAIAQKAHAIFDGQGCARILSEINRLTPAS